jgi:hypothetical protein
MRKLDQRRERREVMAGDFGRKRVITVRSN